MRPLFFAVLVFCFLSQQLKAQESSTALGSADRRYWAELLFKISKPVLYNLSEGNLKKEMPLEKGPGYGMDPAKVSYLEAVGRTLAGIAPWLELPDDTTTESKLRSQLRDWAIKGLPRVVDPLSADKLNFETEQQPLVDAAFLAQAFLRAPNVLWKPLDSVTKLRYIASFKRLRDRKAYYSNWLLFAAMTEAFLSSQDAGHDPARIDIAIQKITEWYVGDGWYSDGPQFALDYYNSYVIHSMLVDILKVGVEKKWAKVTDLEKAQKRMIRYAVLQERMISPEGTFPLIGRSLVYRSGALQALAQVSLERQLPVAVSPAQVRCAMTAVWRRIFDQPDNFDNKGWLQLGFAGHQPEMADSYISTGSLYLCTLGFLPLGLPASDPFWTSPYTEWTNKKGWKGNSIKKDYKVDY